jgi:hypothetical protein
MTLNDLVVRALRAAVDQRALPDPAGGPAGRVRADVAVHDNLS